MRRRRSLIAALGLILLAACSSPAGSSPPSASASQPSDAPEPTPTPVAGDDVIAAFLDMVLDDEFTFHIVATGLVSVSSATGSEELDISTEMDVQGENGVGDAILDLGPGDLTVSMLLVDGVAYLDDNGTWTEIPDYEPTTPLNPFFRLTDEDDLSYAFDTRRGGEPVHRLKSLVWMGGDLEMLEEDGWTDIEVDYSSSEIFVRDDGSPVAMDFNGQFRGVFLGEVVTFVFDVTNEFSAVGEPVEIPEP